MFSVFVMIMNFVFAVMAGVVLAAISGSDWWPLFFVAGFVLWNFVAVGIVLLFGFVFVRELEGGK